MSRCPQEVPHAPRPHRVVIVGAGFAGLELAHDLDGAPVAITVIDQRNHHLFQPLLYQVATTLLATSEIAWPIRRLFRNRPEVTTLLGQVRGIDRTERRVLLRDGASVPYDTLVLATGARHAYFGHDEWEPNAPGLKTLEDATTIRRRLLLAFEHAELATDPEARRALMTFCVIGGGPAGVELTGIIAELAQHTLPREFRSIDTRETRVILVEAGPRVLPVFAPDLSAYATKALEKLGAEVRCGTPVTACDETGIRIGEEFVPARTVIWAAGVQASKAARWLDVPADRAGRVIVEPDLTVPGLPDVFAIGDTAHVAIDGKPVPGVAPAAKQQGAYVARVIRARLAGKAVPGPFAYRHLGNLATVGRSAAVIDFGNTRLTGWPAWWIWGIAHIYFLIGTRSRLTVAISWLWSFVIGYHSARLITQKETLRAEASDRDAPAAAASRAAVAGHGRLAARPRIRLNAARAERYRAPLTPAADSCGGMRAFRRARPAAGERDEERTMQVTETLNEGLKRGYQITVPATELENKVNEKLEEARKDFQMKGFRKGKAPAALMKKMFGKSVLGEAMQESIDAAMRSHFETTGDRPALQPEVKVTNENWEEGQDVEVSMTYEALPQVPELDFSGISLEKLVAEIEDGAIDEALANLASTAKTFDDRAEGAAAEDGDQVVIDFVGKVDGEAFEGGSAEDFPLVLGSGNFIPGFEGQLVGVKAGDSRDVEVTFPAEYGAPNLAGKPATFAVTVKGVKAPKSAEIDDALATRFGADDLAALKETIRGRLVDEYGQASRAILKRRLMDALDAATSFELPPSLVDVEASQIAHQLWHEEHHDHHGHDHGEIAATDEHKKLAERRVKLGLLLAEVGNKNEITVPDQDVQRALFQQARQYPGQERQFLEFVQKNPQALQQLRAPLFEDRVVDYILEKAKLTEKPVSKDELQKAIEALDEDSTDMAGDDRDAGSLIRVERVGVGVIGCGVISAAYLTAARRFPVLDVRAVADLDPAAAAARGAEFGIPAVSVDALFADPSIEIVLNLTIPEAHAEVAVRAIAAGKHVHSEKPLATTLADGRRVLDAADARGVRVGCAPDTFLGGAHQEARRLIDAGAIGTPIGGTAFFLCPGHERWHPAPAFYYRPGGGPVLDMGPYYVTDLVNLLGPVAEVAAMVATPRSERVIGSGPLKDTTIPVHVPTHAAATLRFVTGAVVQVSLSFDVHAHRHIPLEIYGTAGSLIVPDPNFFGGAVRLYEAGGDWREIEHHRRYADDNYRVIGVADMARALREDRPHRASGALALHVLEVMEAFGRSSDSRGFVAIESRPERPALLGDAL